MSRPRLLLIEFISTDRFSQYRSELFPFVQGFARAAGVSVRWLAFGYDPAALPTSRYRMALTADDTAQLVAALRRTAPTHVLLNEELDAPLDAAVRAGARAAGVASLAVYGLDEAACTFERRRELAEWLGAGGIAPHEGAVAETSEAWQDEAWLVDVAEPDYRCKLGNERASAIKPFVQVLGGPGCVYGRAIAPNPAFADVDLTGAHRDGGCTFCGVGADTGYPYATRPVELALRQIRAALATCPPERLVADGRAQFALTGAATFIGLKPLLEAILDEGLPPVDLHLSCRIDELRRKAPVIEALLPRLAAAGHRLALANMGVENFSPAENERFNKGISEEDVFAVVELVNDWERRFPQAFSFWETGGFGFILFTPWTTTADLRINLRAGERLGLSNGSFFFVSRLQLLPGRPIALLADRDGLVAGSPGSAAEGSTELAGFDSGCIVSAREHEVPWRFRASTMPAIYGLFLRVQQTNARGMARNVSLDDPDLRCLRVLYTRLPEAERSPWRLLPLALDVADAHADVRSVSDLLERLEAHLAEALGPPDLAAVDRAEAEAAGLVDSQDETASDREARTFLEARIHELLKLLREHRKDLLRGFVPRSVEAQPTGHGWGSLRVELTRGEERLGVCLLPRDAAPWGFVTTEQFAAIHDEETPADTEDKRHLLRVIAHGFERYLRAR